MAPFAGADRQAAILDHRIGARLKITPTTPSGTLTRSRTKALIEFGLCS